MISVHHRTSFYLMLFSKGPFKLYLALACDFVPMPVQENKPCCGSTVKWSGTDLDGQILWQHNTESHCAKSNSNPRYQRLLKINRLTGRALASGLYCYSQSPEISLEVYIFKLDWCVYFVHPGWGGFTPLHYAALHGNRAMVDLFLSNGADPNVACDAGQTAFHFGCRWASPVHVELAWIFMMWSVLDPLS